MTTNEIMYLGLGVFGAIMVGCATIAFRKWWKLRAARKGKEATNAEAVDARLERLLCAADSLRNRVEVIERSRGEGRELGTNLATRIEELERDMASARACNRASNLLHRVEELEQKFECALENSNKSLRLSGRVEDLEQEVSCLENPPKPESRVVRHWVEVTAERPSKPVPAKKKKRKAARSTGS